MLFLEYVKVLLSSAQVQRCKEEVLDCHRSVGGRAAALQTGK